MAGQLGSTLAIVWVAHWVLQLVDPWAESMVATLANEMAAQLAVSKAGPTASWTVDSKDNRSVVHLAAPSGWSMVASSAVRLVDHSVIQWVHSTVVTMGHQWDTRLVEQ